MGQDQLFESIPEGLLQDFLELFFRKMRHGSTSEPCNSTERRSSPTFPKATCGRPTSSPESRRLTGQPELILVHVEIQGEPRSDFPRRMFEHYSVLRIHHGLPVFPIALYLRGGPPSRLAEHRENLFGQEPLLFRYHCVPLARLEAEEHVGVTALGAALSGLDELDGSGPCRLHRFDARPGDGKRAQRLKHLLVDVIKTYFVLTPEEAERYRRLLTRKEFRAVQEVELTWSEKLIERGRVEGREKGREAGVLEGKRKAVLRQLSAKFGRVPEAIAAQAEGMSEAELDSVLDRILTAETLDDLDLGD